jgi:hypothetical protein
VKSHRRPAGEIFSIELGMNLEYSFTFGLFRTDFPNSGSYRTFSRIDHSNRLGRKRREFGLIHQLEICTAVASTTIRHVKRLSNFPEKKFRIEISQNREVSTSSFLSVKLIVYQGIS